jgi:hypothetical protein
MNKSVTTAALATDITGLIKLLPNATVHKKSTQLLNMLITKNRVYSAYFLIKFNGVYNIQEQKTEFNKLKLLLLLLPSDIKKHIFGMISKSDLINLFFSSKIFHCLFNLPIVIYLSNNGYLTKKCLQYILQEHVGINIDLLLVYACKYEMLELVNYAIKHKADVSFRQEEPLTKACFTGNLEITKILIAAGAKYSENGWFPLKTAIYYQHDNITNYIINESMDPKERLELIKQLALNVF